MPFLAPPAPPAFRVALGDRDFGRVRKRHWLVLATVATILTNIWLFTLGPIPGILGLMVAKHILVAVLAQVIGLDQSRRRL